MNSQSKRGFADWQEQQLIEVQPGNVDISVTSVSTDMGTYTDYLQSIHDFKSDFIYF